MGKEVTSKTCLPEDPIVSRIDSPMSLEGTSFTRIPPRTSHPSPHSAWLVPPHTIGVTDDVLGEPLSPSHETVFLLHGFRDIHSDGDARTIGSGAVCQPDGHHQVMLELIHDLPASHVGLASESAFICDVNHTQNHTHR